MLPAEPMGARVSAAALGERAGTGHAGATSELPLARKAKPNRVLRPARPVLARK